MSGSGLSDERLKAKDLGRLMLSDQDITTLREVIEVLSPSADFTQWAGNTGNPTISQVYPRILEMISAPNTCVTDEARVLRESLDSGLEASWLLNSIPPFMILAMYLNPASASHTFLDRLSSTGGITYR
ncbi:hypothetical protein BGZ99_003548, partial [Dissophora globulifera]